MLIMAGDEVKIGALEGVLYFGHSQDLGTLHDEGADKAGRYLVGIHSGDDKAVGADHDIAHAIEGSYKDGEVVHCRHLALIWADRITVPVVTA